jgi:hypothetical protein
MHVEELCVALPEILSVEDGILKLDDLCARFDRGEFPSASAREHPEREAVLTAREAVTAAVRDDEFLIDCLAHELDVLERRLPRRGLDPFYTLPELGIQFAFGYWPPGRSAGAHEHTAWTITGVCRNQLEVRTFDRAESYRQRTLVPKNLFDAAAGGVGFIYEPCIHDPRNPTDRWSLSLHVISPRDGERLEQDACLPVLEDWRARRAGDDDDPHAAVEMARFHHVLVDQIARFAAGIDVRGADDLLARCGRLMAKPGSQMHDTAATLTVVHQRLDLSCRDVDGAVALGFETPGGWSEQLRMSRLGREAVAFCASRSAFDVGEIPGRLTSNERWAIAEALVESGTFRVEAC